LAAVPTLTPQVVFFTGEEGGDFFTAGTFGATEEVAILAGDGNARCFEGGIAVCVLQITKELI
jgi:hypothetical protein